MMAALGYPDPYTIDQDSRIKNQVGWNEATKQANESSAVGGGWPWWVNDVGRFSATSVGSGIMNAFRQLNPRIIRI
jgi:hypothetical protein